MHENTCHFSCFFLSRDILYLTGLVSRSGEEPSGLQETYTPCWSGRRKRRSGEERVTNGFESCKTYTCTLTCSFKFILLDTCEDIHVFTHPHILEHIRLYNSTL